MLADGPDGKALWNRRVSGPKFTSHFIVLDPSARGLRGPADTWFLLYLERS